MRKKIIALLGGVLAILLPIMYYSMLSIPFADDFGCARESIEYVNECGSWLLGALKGTGDYYIRFQGSYTGIFFMIYLNAFSRWGLIGLRIFNTLCILLFFVSLFILVAAFTYDEKKEWKNNCALALGIFLIILFWITNNYMYSEIYTWHNVIVIYIIPLIFVFLGEAFYIVYVRRQNNAWILASAMGILLGGGAINLATLGCGMYLFTTIYGLCQKEIKDKAKLIIPLASSIIGTLVNVFAPGNFARWGDEKETKILLICFASFGNVVTRLWYFITNTPFIVLILFMFIIAYKYTQYNFEGKLTYRHPIIFAVIEIVGCAIVDFPFALGYRVETLSNTFPDRAFFVQDVAIYLLTTIWVYYFAGYIKKNHSEFCVDRSHVIISIVLSFAFLALMCGNGKYENYTTPYMVRSILDGSAHDYSDYQESIMEMVSEGDDDVIIYYDTNNHAINDKFIRGLRLSDDVDRWDYWRNAAMAHYYGKRSVQVFY